jgi:hypothetical protein
VPGAESAAEIKGLIPSGNTGSQNPAGIISFEILTGLQDPTTKDPPTKPGAGLEMNEVL